MNLKSTLGIAKSGTTSLRATVPEGIVAFLELKVGDKLEWKMEIISEQRVVMVRKAKASEDAAKIASKYAKSK